MKIFNKMLGWVKFLYKIMGWVKILNKMLGWVKILNEMLGRVKIVNKMSEHLIQKVGKSSICCQFLSSEHVNTYARVGEMFIFSLIAMQCIVQGGTICGAIEGSSRSLKSIDKRVFINFRDKYAVFINFRNKNAVFTSFRDKNYVFELHDKTFWL